MSAAPAPWTAVPDDRRYDDVNPWRVTWYVADATPGLHGWRSISRTFPTLEAAKDAASAKVPVPFQSIEIDCRGAMTHDGYGTSEMWYKRKPHGKLLPVGRKASPGPRAPRDTGAADLAEAEAYAVRFAAEVARHGGPTVRLWTKPGIGVRMYFPLDTGFLTMSRGGDIGVRDRGKQSLAMTALPATWRKALAKARESFGVYLAGKYAAEGADIDRLMVLEDQERDRGGKRRHASPGVSASAFARAMKARRR